MSFISTRLSALVDLRSVVQTVAWGPFPWEDVGLGDFRQRPPPRRPGFCVWNGCSLALDPCEAHCARSSGELGPGSPPPRWVPPLPERSAPDASRGRDRERQAHKGLQLGNHIPRENRIRTAYDRNKNRYTFKRRNIQRTRKALEKEN